MKYKGVWVMWIVSIKIIHGTCRVCGLSSFNVSNDASVSYSDYVTVSWMDSDSTYDWVLNLHDE